VLPIRATALLFGVAAAFVAACGGSSSPPPSSSPSPSPGDAIQITGRERFGWSQSADDISPLHFAVYVDGTRVDLPGAACHGSAPSFNCDSPLPALNAGRHVLEVVAWTVLNGDTVESPKASPLIVQVTGSTAPDAITSMTSSSIAESPKAARNTCGLAPISDDRLLLWTGAGEIRMVDRASLTTRTLTLPTLDGWELTGVGAHSRFDETGWIYTVQTNATDLRLIRYRDVNGVLGEAAVLRSVPLPVKPHRAAIAMREADRIYIALLSSSAADAPPRGGSFLIRVNADGSIPAENPVGSVYVSIPSSRLPLAVTWGSDDELPWRLESAGRNTYVLTRRGTATASRPFTAPATPVAMQLDASKRLLVVGADGGVTAFTRTAAGWTGGATRTSATPKQTGDALLFPNGDLITCGTDQDARYVVRRGSVPE
jgi:hypothetical protein